MGGRSFGIWSAPVLGFAFGFGWTPCVGPYLAALIGVTLGQTPTRSALLFGLFSLTLAICFTAAGLLFARALRAFTFLQRNHRSIEIISGGILVLIGVLLVVQLWDNATEYVNRMLAPLFAA
jgi:cytochrome c-type biogenesis protein